MKNFTKKFICVLCILCMIINTPSCKKDDSETVVTPPTQNELNIIGNWTVDSIDASVTVPLPQEDLEEMMQLVELGFLTPDQFMDSFGIPMPTSPEEWDAIATNGITIPISDDEESEIGITEFSFTETLIGVYSEEGMIPLNYTWSSDSIISIEPTDELPFTEFTILSANDDYITLSTSTTMIEEEDGVEMEITYNVIFYCSNKYL